jgi:glucose-1-phosphate cytidylyltransferase
METVILCGGKGTRLREHTSAIPKPMVEIGGRPMLWHIMKMYSHYGFNKFILCLGYKGEKIREYFKDSEWDITFADTGLETNTGGRIKKIEGLITGNSFFATYGDGLSDIDLQKLLDYHKSHKKIATLTAVQPMLQFGLLKLNSQDIILDFEEKPKSNFWINGGFFVFERKIFEYIQENDVLEEGVFKRLAKDKNLVAYRYNGFWKCMDTYKDSAELNEIWKNGSAEWAVWRR